MSAVAFSLLAAWMLRNRAQHAEYDRRIAAIRAAGEPVTEADFAKLYPEPPPERDFRQFLKSALPAESLNGAGEPELSALDSFDGDGGIRSWTNNQPWPAALLERVRAEVATNQPVVEVLLRTNLEDYRFHRDWDQGFLKCDEVKGERIFLRITLARSLALQAAYEAELGDGARATTALVRGLQLARIPSPLGFVGGIGRLASQATALSQVERILNRVDLSDADLQQLQNALSPRDDIMRDALIGERAFQIHCWSHPDLESVSGLSEGPVIARAAFRFSKLVRGWSGRLEMLDRWQQRIQAAALPVPEQIKFEGEMFANFMSWVHPNATPPLKWIVLLNYDQTLLALLEPRVHAFCSEHAMQLARIANARAALAIQRWRLANAGALPSSLSELVPAYLAAVPKDPFDDQPVRYRKTPKGYVVYSIGQDLEDNGGCEGTRGEAPGTDATLIVVSRQAAPQSLTSLQPAH